MTLSSPEWLGLLTDIITVAGIPFALYQIFKVRSEAKAERKEREKEEKRKNDLIELVLETKNQQKITLPTKVRRSFLTRQEVMGRLGSIPMKPTESKSTQQGRFQLKHTNTQNFIENIDKLYTSDALCLTIQCEKEEIEQFDTNKMQRLEFIITDIKT